MENSLPESQAEVPSPCIGVCRMNESWHLCEGCLRTLDEIAQWSNSSSATKQQVLLLIADRRQKWMGSDSASSQEGAD